MENNKLKIVIFIFLILLLFGVLFYAIFGFSVSYLSEEEIKTYRKLKEDLISFIEINNIDTVYDKENNIYYYTVPEEYENKKYTLKINLDDNYKYKIKKHSTNLITVKYNKKFDVIIYNDNYYYETSIVLTNLPLINLTTDTEITDNDTNAVFKYINPYNLDKVITYNSKMHIRGATTRWYDKKSYKIEFYDNEYEKEKNVNISNFYYGSAFILDAMFRDNSKIRNVFASEIWNLVSDDFTNVDIYSEFVELFINNEYVGLYSFTEPVNRKNLNLNKSSINDTSVIIKSNSSMVPNNKQTFYNISSDNYLDYELKYPNDEELFSVSWEKILTKLALYYSSKYDKTKNNIKEIFNFDNYIDILIFNSFVDNSDNDLRKNNYYYMKSLSDKINIQPWDMEFCFGLEYSDHEKYNFYKNIENYDDISFDIDDNDLNKIKKYIINRYWNLRNNVLTEKMIDEYLNKYKNQLTKGASLRDSKKWINYDIEEEIEDIRTWIHNRIKNYDNYIRGLSNE